MFADADATIDEPCKDVQHEDEDEDGDLQQAKTLDFEQLLRAPVRRVSMKWVTDNTPLPNRDDYIYVTDEDWTYTLGLPEPILPYKKDRRKGLPRPPGHNPRLLAPPK